MTTILLNDSEAISARLKTTQRGVWFADVDFDLGVTGDAPSGPVILKIGNDVLVGSVDELASGKFGAKGKSRVIGGRAGWQKKVSARHFKNDAGVFSTEVFTTTALEVGEVVVDANPTRLGTDYIRASGRASRVLDGVPNWYVNQQGITIIGPRVPVPVDPTTVEILEWDPLEQRAEIATDAILAPGSILIDPRIGTKPVIVRDVEQTFSASGARATAWCSENEVSRLMVAMRALIREEAGVVYLKTYRYRVVSEGVDGRLTLQIVKPADGVPNAIPLSVWPGMSGLSAKVTPGSLVRVGFFNADPTDPFVCNFDGSDPLELDLDAELRIVIGKTTGAVEVGTGAEAVALSSKIDALFTALNTWVPVPTDGGAALKTALTSVLLKPSVASIRLRSD